MTKHGKSRTHRILPALPGILDSIALLALVWLASGLWFHSRFDDLRISVPLSLLFAAIAGAGYLSFQSVRRDRYRKGLAGMAYRLWLCDHIVRGSTASFHRFLVDVLCRIKGYLYLPATEEAFLHLALDGQSYGVAALKRHPSCPVTAQELMDCVDLAREKGVRNLIVASSAAYMPEALSYASEVRNPPLELLDEAKLAELAAEAGYIMPETEERRYLVAARAKLRTQRSRRGSFASWARPLRYAVCGALLAGLSLLTPFRTWYLAMAGLCAVLAVVSFIRFRSRGAVAAGRIGNG
jgi:hypothetical protein